MIERIFLTPEGNYRPIFLFSGRLRRRDYAGILVAGYFLINFLFVPLLFPKQYTMIFLGIKLGAVFIILFTVGVLLFIYILIASTARRLHDINKPRWLAFILAAISFIPYLNVIVLAAVVLLISMPGTIGPNQYGDDPVIRSK